MSVGSGFDDLASVDVVRAAAEWRVPGSKSERADRTPFETIWLRLHAWFFLFAGVVYHFVLGREFQTPEVLFMSQIEVMGMVALSQFALHFLYWRLANKIVLSYGLRRLKTKVPSDDACPVCIEVMQSGVITGYDEGYLWIDEGTLYYKGLQTVFRINASDVLPAKEWPRSHRPNLDEGRLPRWIHLRGASDPMDLHIKLIDPFEDYGARRRSANFDRTLAKWLAERPEGSLESRLPPFDLHPSLTSIGRFRFEGFVAGCVLMLTNLVLMLTARIGSQTNDLGDLGNMLPVVVGGVLFVFAARMAYQNYHNIQVRMRLGAH